MFEGFEELARPTRRKVHPMDLKTATAQSMIKPRARREYFERKPENPIDEETPVTR
jgi:hypothetical protein